MRGCGQSWLAVGEECLNERVSWMNNVVTHVEDSLFLSHKQREQLKRREQEEDTCDYSTGGGGRHWEREIVEQERAAVYDSIADKMEQERAVYDSIDKIRELRHTILVY